MITYLPYADFPKTFACLHDVELEATRKSALEIACYALLHRCKTIPPTITLPPMTGNKLAVAYKDPGVRMWLGFEGTLINYGLLACLEWQSRGHEDRLLDQFATLQKATKSEDCHTTPWWLYMPALSRSHQSLLTAVRRGWYSAFWKTDSNWATFWPVGPKLDPMPF